mmetsp:Transcript_14735/g.38076  ORF Transcript_14735/g.38076 Transcript_14735/m.38076 type:complete len:217 (+) Transcript_14735:35-685(+)
MVGAMRRASVSRPLSTAAATGFVVMSAGDAVSQTLVEGSTSPLDVQRNLVSSAWSGLASPAFYKWYRFMDWLIPGATMFRLVPKTLLSQIVTTGLNNPCYLVWCNHVEALLGGNQSPVNWAAVRDQTAKQLIDELPSLYGTSMIFWLPVTGANYALVPDYLKILWVSSASVAWGGFVSHVAHRGGSGASSAGSDSSEGTLFDHAAVACTDHEKMNS